MQAPMSVEVDTVVVVEDDMAGREIARWPMTHTIEGARTESWPAKLDQVFGKAGR
jgi:hypothetical protein